MVEYQPAPASDSSRGGWLRHLPLWLWFLFIVRPVVRLLIGVGVFGREHLRVDRPSIIIANHNSHLDAAVLMDLLPLSRLLRVRPVAAADYFEQSALRRIIFTRCMNALAIRRDRVTKEHNPLRAMCEALDRGESLILFPEGTRGRPECLAEFQTGIVHLIGKRPGVPVIPVFMRNLGFSLPKGDMVLVPMFCDVYVGEPRVINGDRTAIMQQVRQSFTDLRELAESMLPSEPAPDDR